MFDIASLEKRLADVAAQVEQSAANHHVLVGSKLTIEGMIMEAKKASEAVAAVEAVVATESATTGE